MSLSRRHSDGGGGGGSSTVDPAAVAGAGAGAGGATTAWNSGMSPLSGLEALTAAAMDSAPHTQRPSLLPPSTNGNQKGRGKGRRRGGPEEAHSSGKDTVSKHAHTLHRAIGSSP